MSWYVSKIVFQIICGEGLHKPQFDEQIRLIQAVDAEDAFQKASSIGGQEEDAFYNDKQQLVQWKFIDVCDLIALGDIIEGAELCSMVKEAEDATLYINFVHDKAKKIKEKFSSELLNLI